MTKSNWLLILPGLAMLGCFIAMVQIDHFTRQAPTFLTYFMAAFVFYFVAIGVVLWIKDDHRNVLILIAAFSILFRVSLWFSTPTLSTDVWRYIWDGRLFSNGINPYMERVDSPELDFRATPLRERVDHQWMASPYPPVAQITFAGTYLVFPESSLAMQVIFTLFDLASGAVIVLLLRHLGRSVSLVVLYLWNPLIVVEFAHGAHLDSLMTLLVLLTIYWYVKKQKTWSMVSLALATLVKFIPALLLPMFVRQWGIRRTVVYSAIVVGAFLPFSRAGLGLTNASDGTGIFGALRIYNTQWQTNDGLIHWMSNLLDAYSTAPVDAAKLVGLGILVSAALWVFVNSLSDTQDFDKVIVHSVLLISVYTLFSATVFPWYLAWLIALLPLLPFQRDYALTLLTVAWLYFSAAVNLSYLFYVNPNQPGEIEWVRQVEYLPLYILLAGAMVTGLWQRHYQV